MNHSFLFLVGIRTIDGNQLRQLERRARWMWQFRLIRNVGILGLVGYVVYTKGIEGTLEALKWNNLKKESKKWINDQKNRWKKFKKKYFS